MGRHRTRFFLTVLANVILLFEPVVAFGQIRINELDIAPTDGRSEFVELLIVGSDSLLLTDIELQDARVSTGRLLMSGDHPLYTQPGEIIVLARYPGVISIEYPGVAVFEVKPWPTLNNGGDLSRVLLRGTVLDEVVYTANDYERGTSLERIDPFVPANIKSNWAPSIAFSGGTPGLPNSVYHPDSSAPALFGAWYTSDSTIEVLLSEPIAAEIADGLIWSLDGSIYSGTTVTLSASRIQLSAVPLAVTKLTVGGVVDYSGNASGLLSVEVAHTADPGDLLITELLYDPGLDEKGSRSAEWVEIYNAGSRRISLRNVIMITGKTPFDRSVQIPVGASHESLGSGHFALVFSAKTGSTSSEACVPCLPESDRSVIDILSRLPSSSLSLYNSGATVSIVRDSTVQIDAVSYRPDWSDAALRSTQSHTLERISLQYPGRGPLSWSSSLFPGGTPGALYDLTNPSFTPLEISVTGRYPPRQSIRINEIMFDPLNDPDDGLIDQVEYIEFVNVSTISVDLNALSLISGSVESTNRDTLRLVFRPTHLGAGETAVIFHIPSFVDDGPVSARGFLDAAFPPEKTSPTAVLIPTRANLSLSSTGEFLQLISPESGDQESLRYSDTWHHPLLLNTKGISLERLDISGNSDQGSNWSSSASSTGGTPGYSNSVAVSVRPFPDGLPEDRTTVQIEPKTIMPASVPEVSQATISVSGGKTNGTIVIQVFDLQGRMVRDLIPHDLYPGSYRAYWNGLSDSRRLVPSGIYIVLVQVHYPDSYAELIIKRPVSVFSR